MNFILVEGILTEDLKLRTTNFKTVCEFEILTEKKFIYKIFCEDKLASVCGKYLKKGSRVLSSLTRESDEKYKAKEINFLWSK